MRLFDKFKNKNTKITFIENAGGVIITKSIYQGTSKLKWLFREESVNPSDNGWRAIGDNDTQEYLDNPENSMVVDFNTLAKDTNDFTPEAKKLLNTDRTKLEGNAKDKFNLVKGAVELGSFISSIVGLTIVAPLVSHELLHPIMKAIGMDNKHKEKNIGKPNEIYLADAKVKNDDKKVKIEA
jgi:hypothetical protein